MFYPDEGSISCAEVDGSTLAKGCPPCSGDLCACRLFFPFRLHSSSRDRIIRFTRKEGPPMNRIVLCLWFDNQAPETATFYGSIFKNSKLGPTT